MSRFDRTSNPAFKSEYFESAFTGQARAMTVQGAINKIAFLLLLAVVAASFTWRMTYESPLSAQSFMILGLIGGFITALITIFSPAKARYTAPVYALFEGLLLGAISALYNLAYQGIVLQAMLMTFATLGGMLFLYKSGIVRPTERFKAGMMTAMTGLLFGLLFSFLLSLFGFASPLYSGSPVGIIISLVIVVIAALNLILDFDMIVKGEANNAPEHFEWYAAFGMMVTLIWLYLEILRFLALLQRRD